jgi:disease resistance protein RPM1
MELAAAPELGSLLAEADGVYKLPRGVKEDIHFLERELENMQAFFSKIGEVRADELDELTKVGAADLRNSSIHVQQVADNLRDRIRTHRSRMADLQGLKGFAARINFKVGRLRARHEFATSIRELKNRLMESAERLRLWYRMDLFHGPARRHATTEDLGGLQLLPDTNGLVGIDSHKEKLVNILTEEGGTSTQQLKVVAIVGDGPVGKTTLAKVVYHSIVEQQLFDVAAWVTVPSRPDITKILRGMLRQINQEDQEDYIRRLDPKQLIDKIRRTLHDKRYQ